MATTEDYTTWTCESLISRIHALESALGLTQVPTTAASPAPGRFKKPPKAPKPFNASRYSTRLIALKFAYLGGAYNGFEHHANNSTPLPTVEEVLWRALRKVRLIFPDFPEGKTGGRGRDEQEEVCWEGVEYSKCGRTDKGVSAFGQVVGLRVRSARPLLKAKVLASTGADENDLKGTQDEIAMDDVPPDDSTSKEPPFDPVKDELPYIQMLNRVLPSDIRILAWCPNLPPNFSARFNCRERRYRYFFTNPAFAPLPGNEAQQGSGWLDIEAMQSAAKKYEGLHDFRNFCKIDASKQIENFERRIFNAGIHRVEAEDQPASLVGVGAEANGGLGEQLSTSTPQLYWFEVRGSAFLWHQVRHLMAVLFLVGQGWEQPELVDQLLDVSTTPGRPVYDMASDVPLVLWDCIFPDPERVQQADHAGDGEVSHAGGYEDGLDWVYVGDSEGGQDQAKKNPPGVEDGKYGRGGVMDDLWVLWRQRKMEEILAGSLMNVVRRQGKPSRLRDVDFALKSDRVYDGSELPRTVGTYNDVMQRERMESPDVVNVRYAARKGLQYPRPRRAATDDIGG
ncbi:pseudouridine synthase deg1 [Oleoguttula sp. CCFEE 5521]